jgi:hypothetical protein
MTAPMSIEKRPNSCQVKRYVNKADKIRPTAKIMEEMS